MSPWVCTVPEWSDKLVMDIDFLSQLGAPQYCWGVRLPAFCPACPVHSLKERRSSPSPAG